MNVSLTAKLEKMVKTFVESGRYTSASGVVRDPSGSSEGWKRPGRVATRRLDANHVGTEVTQQPRRVGTRHHPGQVQDLQILERRFRRFSGFGEGHGFSSASFYSFYSFYSGWGR